MSNKPQLTSIGDLALIAELEDSLLLEVESTTEGSKHTTLGSIKTDITNDIMVTVYTKDQVELEIAAALEIVYTKDASDLRYKAIDAKESWTDVQDKPVVIAAGVDKATARSAIDAGTSNLVVGTEAGTAAEGNDARILGAIQSTEKGVALGVATLDSAGLIPSDQLPSFVDDVMEFANLAALPVEGETGKIYVTLDTNLTYRWGGSGYVNLKSGDVVSVNGRKGAITGLAEQSDLDDGLTARYTKAESDARYRTISTAVNTIVAVDVEGAEVELPYATSATANAIAQRGTDGTLTAADATVSGHVVNKGQMDLAFDTVYTKSETDSRYHGKDVSYTKTEVDALVDNVGETLKTYSLPLVTTTGAIDLSVAQVFKVSAGVERTVTITNIPAGRSVVAVLKLIGDGAVTWPSNIDWVDGSAPVLGGTYTTINLLFIDGTVIGSVMITK